MLNYMYACTCFSQNVRHVMEHVSTPIHYTFMEIYGNEMQRCGSFQ